MDSKKKETSGKELQKAFWESLSLFSEDFMVDGRPEEISNEDRLSIFDENMNFHQIKRQR